MLYFLLQNVRFTIMSIANISGLERYSQYQTQGQNLAEVQKKQGVERDEEGPEKDLLDLSDRWQRFAAIAQDFPVEHINFPEVLRLRQTLFEAGEIDIRQVNTLTLATQTMPDQNRFNLLTAVEMFAHQDTNHYLFRELEGIHQAVENLLAARESAAILAK
mgnify:FL=1